MSIGKVVLDLPPKEGNPRNSEGSFVTLADGAVLFAYSRYRGESWDDAAEAVIAKRISRDGGETWSDEETLIEKEGAQNVMSVSFLRLQSGKIALFYLVKNNISDCYPGMRLSSDEGKTWTDPVRAIPAPGYFVVNNDRVIQTRSGRLIVPAALHRTKQLDLEHPKAFDGRGIAMWFYSDDEGATWTEAKTWWALPVHSSAGLQEPGVVEKKDGSLYCYCRTSVGVQYAMTSTDDGDSWSSPQPTEFRSPASPLSMKRLPGSQLVAVWNDKTERYNLPKSTASSWDRTPLVVAVSESDGLEWQVPHLIESEPDHGYCYTAIHPMEDSLFLAYCAGGPEDKSVLSKLRLRKIAYREILRD